MNAIKHTYLDKYGRLKLKIAIEGRKTYKLKVSTKRGTISPKGSKRNERSCKINKPKK